MSLNDYELNNVRELVKELEKILDDHETRITELEEE